MIIFIPGFSLKNKEEMLNISNNLFKEGYEIYKHEWNHWNNPEALWKPDYEAEIILNQMNAESVGIIAKSLGTCVAMKVVKRSLDKVKYVILMGIPLNDLDNNEKNEYELLKSLNIPIFIIHNLQDSHGKWEDVKKFLEGVEYRALIKESDTHSYDYPKDILKILQEVER